MSAFRDIVFEEPYPAYKAFIVPYREKDEVIDVRRVTGEEVNAWRCMLEELRQFIIGGLDFAERGRTLNETERLELIGDLIALFLKIPLLRELLPSTAPNPIKFYMLLRLRGLNNPEIKKIIEGSPLHFANSLYEPQLIKTFLDTDVVKVVDSREIGDLVENCWFSFPADTRPVCNSSNLIVHLLLTSALAWSLAVERGLNRNQLALLRLAALLHDAGKPFRYGDHVRASMEVAEKLLKNIISDDEVERILGLIKAHHAPQTIEESILRRADGFASGIDRLAEFAKEDEELRKAIGELAESIGMEIKDAYEGPKSWEFWRKVADVFGEEKIRDLSSKAVRRLRRKTQGFTMIFGIGKSEETGAELVCIDVGSVQSFVYRASELRCVTAASLVVDSLTMAQLPALIQLTCGDHGFPYEAFIYTAGAVVNFIAPKKIVEKVREELKERRVFRECDLPLRIASTPLRTDYSETLRVLSGKMQREKFSVEREEREVERVSKKGVKFLCEACYLKPPKKAIITVEGRKNVCDICFNLYRLGSDLHFKTRYEKSEIWIKDRLYRPREVFGEEYGWDTAGQKIMELIAGHDLEEFFPKSPSAEKELMSEGAEPEGGEIRYRNLAVIAADGNLMGSFMASSLSLADAIERSARIDLALKKAMEKAVSLIFDGTPNKADAAKAAVAIKLGIMYAGGDDALMFVPSWTAPIISYVLMREFRLSMGKKRGLTVGVMAAPPKANIWGLIGAAKSLMKKAKLSLRQEPHNSAICFDVIEAGALTANSAKLRLRALEEDMLTRQPLKLGENEDDLKELVDGIFGKISLSKLVSKGYTLSRKGNSNDKEYAKRIRTCIRNILMASKNMLAQARDLKNVRQYALSIAYIYAMRQAMRAKERGDGDALKAYNVVKGLIPPKVGEPTSLADADILIKLLGGGTI